MCYVCFSEVRFVVVQRCVSELKAGKVFPALRACKNREKSRNDPFSSYADESLRNFFWTRIARMERFFWTRIERMGRMERTGEAKSVPLCTKKGRRRKNINRNHARGARFHLSHLYVFQGYIHFLQTLHSSGLKFDNQKGLVCRVWCANPTQNPSLCRLLRRSV